MKVVSFITEYNPFHFGHKYHLEKSLEISGATHSIALMSGSFLQRGEPSLVDKWTKAKMAVENGVDLVLELPFIYACQTAELFALGGVRILESLNIVDYLVFGSERGNLQPLDHIAQVLVEEPKDYRKALKSYLDKGLSFPAARSLALEDYFKERNPEKIEGYDYKEILRQSNNILGIEYLKALKKIHSKIKPLTIKRVGSDYKEERLKSNFASATAIRKGILEKGLGSIRDYVPTYTYKLLEDFYIKYKAFNDLDNYLPIIKYLLLTMGPAEIASYLDVEAGLENRLVEKSFSSRTMDQLIDSISTRRYPKTRIQRILIHLLMDLKAEMVESYYNSQVPYIRFLAANKKGLELLKLIKERSQIPILNKFAHYERLLDESFHPFIQCERKATDLYYLGLGIVDYNNMDYKISPYIKRD